MANIKCPQLHKIIPIKDGGNLMQTLKSSGLPVASSCGGDGVCGKCRIKIERGMEKLNKETPLEARLKEKNNFITEERVSCLTRVFGDIEIKVDYW